MGWSGMKSFFFTYTDTWHFTQLEHYFEESLNNSGQNKPNCNTFKAIFLGT